MPKTSKKTITATDTANTNVFLIADCSFRGFIAPVHRKRAGHAHYDSRPLLLLDES
jgi:hypothetical protein